MSKIPQRSLAKFKKNLPASSVSIIGLGCSSFSTFFWSEEDWQKQQQGSSWTVQNLDEHHPIVQEWIDTILYAVLQAGITLLDTAPWYGHGTSETVIGWAMKRLLLSRDEFNRESILINTKVGRYEADPARQFDFSHDATLKSVQRSLERMQCRYIDVVQLHDPEFAPTISQLLDETIPALLECRDERKWCKALGMTGYPLEVQHQLLQATLERFETDKSPVWDQALTYGHYNLHDTSLFNRTFIKNAKEDNNKDGNGSDSFISFANFCERHNMAVLAAAPLSMGLLTNREPPEWHPASPALQQACHDARDICTNNNNLNIADLATLFALAEPRIPCTIVGMKNVDQVKAAQRMAQRVATATSSSQPPKDATSSSAHVDPLRLLEPILTKDEYLAAQQILDPNEGPFAKLWASSGGGGVGWDGLQEVRNFWKQLPDAGAQEWQTTTS